MPNNKLLTELTCEAIADGKTWHRNTEKTDSGCYCWCVAKDSKETDKLLTAAAVHFTVVPNRSGAIDNVHYSAAASYIYYYKPRTRGRPATWGWGSNISQKTKESTSEDSIKRMLAGLLTAWGLDHPQGLVPQATTPKKTVKEFKLNLLDFPSL